MAILTLETQINISVLYAREISDIRDKSSNRLCRDPPRAPSHRACAFKSSADSHTIRLPHVN